MAIMCPIKDEDSFAPNSNEKMMYELLQKLDDNYYIFHSLRMLNVDAGLVEREVDFVVFNQAHGILFIEAKNTRPILKDQTWFYENGRRMNYGSPYVQASTAMYNFLDILKNKYGEKGKEIKRNCKMIYCVWLPLVSSSELNWEKMPLNASREITITKDDHENLQDRIEEIMSQPVKYIMETKLEDEQKEFLLDNVLCPKFKVMSIPELKLENNRKEFHYLLKEQVRLLNYLDEQRFAAINGRAGTGKTMMALEKAKRHANEGEKVLFLVFNRKLAYWLRKKYGNDYPEITFTTAGSLIYEVCGEKYANECINNHKYKEGYSNVAEILNVELQLGKFKYRHIIIDEGQDFYQPGIVDIPNLFQEWIELYDENDPIHSQIKSFYVFYDKNQLVQGSGGKYSVKAIDNADCKLTLYINCRNTLEIAQTAEMMLKKGGVTGNKPKVKIKRKSIENSSKMFIIKDASEAEKALIQALQYCTKKGINDIQVLTCTSFEESFLKDIWKESLYGDDNDRIYYYSEKYILITKASLFKGLDAEAIILTDLKPSLFDRPHGINNWNTALLPYVGASRARLQLIIIAEMTEAECKEVLKASNIDTEDDYEQKVVEEIFNAEYIKLG
ncbi:nuclease-related domain-containing DEAD/DEAH box helicase [Selenomonas ruminantium]|uniref:nuclease-related domain-containing DEAD/DEAH box helicase n=1 Tax=Selenomonas ruminantium TaxID=971 RepID=UPI0026ED2594|nr:nuclease-related domain-containing DEAD/DEAH box helicase [Selenomonas ruminantium]